VVLTPSSKANSFSIVTIGFSVVLGMFELLFIRFYLVNLALVQLGQALDLDAKLVALGIQVVQNSPQASDVGFWFHSLPFLDLSQANEAVMVV